MEIKVKVGYSDQPHEVTLSGSGCLLFVLTGAVLALGLIAWLR